LDEADKGGAQVADPLKTLVLVGASQTFLYRDPLGTSADRPLELTRWRGGRCACRLVS
jgi:hypothetical protein